MAWPARAQNSIDIQRFTPAVTTGGFVNIEGSSVRWTDDRWELGLLANYARNPLVIADNNGRLLSSIVNGRLGFDAIVSFTIVGPLALGFDVPFFVAQTGDINPSFAGLGDLRIVPKVRLVDDREKVGLALVAEVRPPTHFGDGVRDFAGGRRGIVFWPKIVLDHMFKKTARGLHFGINAGALVRAPTTQYANVVSASEFTYAGALGYRFGGISGPVELGVEMNGGVGLTRQTREQLPLEGLLYLKGYPSDQWEIIAGPGLGLIPGYGVPVARAFLGFRWTPTFHDRDHDGIPDSRDLCPDVPEDRDGDRDMDGCPEDDDHDGIPNAYDLCPNAKETINGFQDADGCPDAGDPRVIYANGKVQVLDTVRFRPGSAEIDPQSHSLLDQVALTIKANPDIKRVRVEGHTDETGNHDMNVELSRARASAVREYLIRRGVSPRRLTAEGYGPDRPIARGRDPASLARNRRVEFVVEQ
jgi:outer membrane protein OmpA-like peptidoglycan-associated protein